MVLEYIFYFFQSLQKVDELEKFQFDNFISMHTKQLVYTIDCFFYTQKGVIDL